MKSIQLKNDNFKPEIFFSQSNIFVEGPSDEVSIAAISESLDDIFEKYSIQIINVGGKDTLENYVDLLEAYSIPHVALVDYDYNCDDEKPIPRLRKKTRDWKKSCIFLTRQLKPFLISIRIIHVTLVKVTNQNLSDPT